MVEYIDHSTKRPYKTQRDAELSIREEVTEKYIHDGRFVSVIEIVPVKVAPVGNMHYWQCVNEFRQGDGPGVRKIRLCHVYEADGNWWVKSWPIGATCRGDCPSEFLEWMQRKVAV